MAEIDSNIAASMGLMVTYAFLLVSFTSISDLIRVFETICGGIPFVSEIADYGSLMNVFHYAPLEAAMAFLDVVFLSTIINILSLLPLTSGSATGKFMVKMFTGVVLSLVSLMILNYVIKDSEPYRYLVAVIGGIITMISVGSIPLTIITLINSNKRSGIGLVATLLVFSKSRIVGIFRDSMFKSLIYVGGIYLLESRFGTIANSMSQLSILVVAFAPVAIMLIGIVFILKSVFTK